MKLTVPIKVEIDEEKLQFLYDEGYKQGRADERNEMLKNAHRSLRLMYEKGKAEVIDKINNAIEELLKEPQYQHEGEDWMNGLIMAQEILYNMSSELEEKSNG